MKFVIDKNRHEYLSRINEILANIPPKNDNGDEKERPFSIADMDMDELDNLNLDVFDEIRLKVNQVAYGYANSLLITGQSGVGKSYDTEQALEKSNKEYESISGGVSTAGLFELLFVRNGEIILFDDCDSVFGSIESINILKSALDSKPIRKISRSIKSHFETKGMSQEDIMANYLGDYTKMSKSETSDNPNEVARPHLFNIANKDKLPKNFIYTGRIIFISNFQKDEIDPTIITRASAHIDVNLTHDEIISRMRMVLKATYKNVPMEKKEEVLRLIDYLNTNYVTRHPLSIRGLINAIETRLANDFPTQINGRSIPMWQLLIKKNMLGKNSVRRPKISEE
tara:strand:+ start:456 stop:1478 length:1023 start_codon:yes stop_codon:yes gene_type:complete